MVLRLRVEAPDWRKAKCATFTPEHREDPWFGEVNGKPAEELGNEARRICNGDADTLICPLRHRCLAFALINCENYGIWGGMREEDRKYIRNHVTEEDWIWSPPLRAELLEAGAALRARKSKAVSKTSPTSRTRAA